MSPHTVAIIVAIVAAVSVGGGFLLGCVAGMSLAQWLGKDF